MVAFLVALWAKEGDETDPHTLFFVKFGQNTEHSYTFKTVFTCINLIIFYAYPFILSPFKHLTSFRANPLIIV